MCAPINYQENREENYFFKTKFSVMIGYIRAGTNPNYINFYTFLTNKKKLNLLCITHKKQCETSQID